MAFGVGQVEQTKILSPQEHLANALKLRAAQLEIDQQTAETAQKLRAEAENQKRQAWLQTAAQTYTHDDGSPDMARIANEAMKVDPDYGLALQKRNSEIAEQGAKLQETELANKVNRYGMVATLADHVNDDNSYAQFRPAAIAIDPELKDLPDHYDPGFMQQLKAQGMLHAGYAKQHLEAEQAASKGLLDADGYLARVLPVCTSQGEVDDAFKGAAIRFHLTADQVAALKQTWPSQFGNGYQEHVADLARTQAQRDLNVRSATDDQRQAARDAEMADYHRQMAAKEATQAGENVPLDPGATELLGAQWRLSGNSAIPTRFNDADKKRIINAGNKQREALGQSPAAVIQGQLATKADQAALSQVQKMQSTAQAYEQKANAQTGLIEQLSQKVGRTQIPMLNRAIVAGKADLAGDVNAQNLTNAILTFSAEYAKIMEGSTGSVAGSSDASRKAADRLINTGLTPQQMKATLDQMKWEMRQTLVGYEAAKQSIQEGINTRVGGSSAPAVPASNGRVRVKGPNGETGTVPASGANSLPPGWSVVP